MVSVPMGYRQVNFFWTKLYPQELCCQSVEYHFELFMTGSCSFTKVVNLG